MRRNNGKLVKRNFIIFFKIISDCSIHSFLCERSPRILPTGDYVELEPVKNRTLARVQEAGEPGAP